MQTYRVPAADAGQRLDKFLAKYFSQAEKGFLYKMLRKKNITLNGKKAEGPELLQAGDELRFFFSEETFAKFRGSAGAPAAGRAAAAAPAGGNAEKAAPLTPAKATAGDASFVKPVYEDEHIIIMNKPAGMLSQKAQAEDVSLCEHLEAYLSRQGENSSAVFRAGVANRLDRNTSGLVMAGKTLPGQQLLAALLRGREVQKYYSCIVKGQPKEKRHSLVYWQKDETTNTVTIRPTAFEGAEPVEIEFEPEKLLEEGFALLRVRLITGKTHQIRAQLKALGYPVLGDKKYGDLKVNSAFTARFGYPLRHQLLHARQLRFPAGEPACRESLSPLARQEAEKLRGLTAEAPLPLNFHKVMAFLGGE